MKYIKTDDGRIIDTTDWYWCDDDFGNNAIHQKQYPFEDIQENEIIAQADTIWELCDYVWYKEKLFEPKLESIYYDVTSVMKKPRVEGIFEYVRLTILVGKDLKTVAEMNDKGEWEFC